MHILLVEDNTSLAEGLSALLRQSGYAVDVVNDGLSADALISAANFDLVILDLNLPQLDGLDVLRRMRARRNQAPVLILTARGLPDERVRGLDLGADDYMVKPFDIGEFEARIRTLLRRQAGLRTATVEFGRLTYDQNGRSFSVDGALLDLPTRERGLLELLIKRAGKVIARDAIIQSLTELEGELSANAIEQYVSRLRKRLAPFDLTVKTARGIGYYLDRAPE